jgi:hypothetical protein
MTTTLTELLSREIAAAVVAADTRTRATDKAAALRGGGRQQPADTPQDGVSGVIETAGMLPAGLQHVEFYWSFDPVTQDLTVTADRDVGLGLWLRVTLPDGTVTGVFQGRPGDDGRWRANGKAWGEVVQRGDGERSPVIRLACQLELISDLDQPVWTQQQYARRNAQRAGAAARRLITENRSRANVSLNRWLETMTQWINVGELWESLEDGPRAVLAYQIAVRCAAQGGSKDMASEAQNALARMDPGWAPALRDADLRPSPDADPNIYNLARALTKWACSQLLLIAPIDALADNIDARLDGDERDIDEIADIGGPDLLVRDETHLALLRLARLALRHHRADEARRLHDRVTATTPVGEVTYTMLADLRSALRREGKTERQPES